MNDLWGVVFTQQFGQEGLRGSGLSVPPKQVALHNALLAYRPPQPLPDTIHRRADLLQIPPRTPPGFPITQVFREQGTEVDAPFTEGLVAHLDAAPVQQFLDVAVTEQRAVGQPHGVLDGLLLGNGGGRARRRSRAGSLPRPNSGNTTAWRRSRGCGLLSDPRSQRGHSIAANPALR